MFRLNPSPTFEAEIALTVPGQSRPEIVFVTFKHKPKAALKKWIESAPSRKDVELLTEVMVGWRNVVIGAKEDIEDQSPIDFSLPNLEQLLENYPTAHQEFFNGYLKEMTEAKRKN